MGLFVGHSTNHLVADLFVFPQRTFVCQDRQYCSIWIAMNPDDVLQIRSAGRGMLGCSIARGSPVCSRNVDISLRQYPIDWLDPLSQSWMLSNPACWLSG